MDFGSLIIIIGAGATIDAVSDVKQGKTVVPAMLAAAFLLVLLSAIGRVTGRYGITGAFAFLYLLASVFKNYKNIPALNDLFTTH